MSDSQEINRGILKDEEMKIARDYEIKVGIEPEIDSIYQRMNSFFSTCVMIASI